MTSCFKNFSRDNKGGVPIHVPLLIFCYSLIFLVCVEFVMLFWLQTSLNAAARQVAVAAATNTSYPVEDVRNRCISAAKSTKAVGPGYSEKVREDYIRGLENGLKNYNVTPFDQQLANYTNTIGHMIQGTPDELLRHRLADMGAQIPPGGFWRGAGSNMQLGGCFALQNPITKQVTFHTVIHSMCTWPVFLKGFFGLTHRMSGGQKDLGGMTKMDGHIGNVTNRGQPIQNQGYCGWLEGRGAFIAKASGADTLGVNRSLLTTGVRPCVFCTQNECDYHGQANQSLIAKGIGTDGRVTGQTGVAQPYDSYSQSNINRPRANTTVVGTKQTVYAIDQWPKVRNGYCERCTKPCDLIGSRQRGYNTKYCEGKDEDPAGIRSIINCGDIDPLVLVGLRYSCQGEMHADGRTIPLDILGRCDHYFRVIPCEYPDEYGVSMPYTAGDVTDLDGQGNPVVIRRKGNVCTDTKVFCRTDSLEVRPWVGPFWAIGANKDMKPDQLHQLIAQGYKDVDDDQYETKDGTPSGKNPLANPLDQLIPYHQVCDICNSGSPMCGFFGTCKDEEIYWKEAKVSIRGQWWSNTSYYELNPMYFQLECKYRRDCQLQHCCWGVWNNEPQKMTDFCASRQIQGGNTFRIPCRRGESLWRYKGVPNATAAQHTPRSLQRDGGFSMCSSAAVEKYGQESGECCAADVELIKYDCGGMPQPRELVAAKPCINCNPNAPGDCRCVKKKGTKFCTTPTCFKKGGKCPLPPEKICKNPVLCPIPPGPGTSTSSGTTTTTTTTSSGTTTTTTTTTTSSGFIVGPSTSKPCQTCFLIIVGIQPSSSSSSSSSSGGGECKEICDKYYSPLVVSLDGSDIKPSGKSVDFKLNPVSQDKFRWIKFKKGQGFIAYDFNENGIIDSGSELFGNFTNNSQYKDGYQALLEFADKNKDKVISGKELEGLLLWEDLNGDGESQENEISELTKHGVTEINVGKDLTIEKTIIGDGVFATPHDEDGIKLKIDGKEESGQSWDVWLKKESNDEAQVTINLWTELRDRMVAFFEGGKD